MSQLTKKGLNPCLVTVCTFMMYNRYMKKRTNMYFDEDDRALLALIKEHYNLSSDAAAVRLALKRIAEEIRRHVPGQTGPHRHDCPTR